MIFLVGFVVEFSLTFQCKTLPVGKFWGFFLVGMPNIKQESPTLFCSVFLQFAHEEFFSSLAVSIKKKITKTKNSLWLNHFRRQSKFVQLDQLLLM